MALHVLAIFENGRLRPLDPVSLAENAVVSLAISPAAETPPALNVGSDQIAEDEDWTAAVAQEWADDLNDARQDIYTLADGEPVDAS